MLASAYNNDTICFPIQHTYDTKDLLSSRQLMYDTDTVYINGKYGLYTIIGNEVISPLYDSLKTEKILVRGFKDGRSYLINYMGEMVRKNLRIALPILYRYQVLEDDGRMYFVDKEGNESDSYFYSFMSVDDILYPLGLDIVLLPPGKPKYSKKKYKQYTWVSFIYPYRNGEFERLKLLRSPFIILTEEKWKQMGFKEEYDPFTVLEYKLDFERDVIERYGIDRIKWADYYDQRSAVYGYNIEVYDILKDFSNLKLISGEATYYR
ncbi:MAG: hypothetical protein LIO65_05655, partial [Odoribacter sp.]|nr:hypothetical protein [Odoribacter sp.]